MIQATTLDAYKLLHAGSLALSRAEQAGMRIDIEYCERKKAHLARKINFLKNEFKESDFYKHWKHVYGSATNIGSDPQLAHLLYDIKKLEPLKMTEKGGRGSTDEESLRMLGIPALIDLIDINKLTKLKDTYLDSFVREAIDGFIHPFFNLHLVRTYRSSSDHPNFQNIPKRDVFGRKTTRRAIFPRYGHLLMESDFSGIEVCIGEAYHKDPVMKKYIMDPTTDMHRDMAIQIFFIKNFDKKIPGHKTLRNAAKNGFVFPQFYGDYHVQCAYYLACQWGELTQGRWGPGEGIEVEKGVFLSDLLRSGGVRSYDDFVEHLKDIEKDFWGRRFRIYDKWKNRWWKQYQHDGYFDMLTGFRCSGLMSKKHVCNYPIQGSAFHCCLWSFIRVDQIAREEGWDTRLIGQIHDALVLDVHPDELEHVYWTIKRVAEEELTKAWRWINVPLEIETEICNVDEPWSEKYDYKIAA
jgi:DNA polymerase I-like protein with 3'-5' exonuclease and polymerase domains